MLKSEVAALLGYISLTDNRKVDTKGILAGAWHESLDRDMELADAKAAVIDHRRNSTEYLTIAHINAFNRKVRRARVDVRPVMEIPAGLHQAQERAWVLTFWDAVKAGNAAPQSVADAALGVVRSDHLQITNATVSGQLRALAGSKGIR